MSRFLGSVMDQGDRRPHLLARDKNRPAMKRSNGVAMLNDSNEIRVFMFSCFRTKIVPAAYNSLIVIS